MLPISAMMTKSSTSPGKKHYSVLNADSITFSCLDFNPPCCTKKKMIKKKPFLFSVPTHLKNQTTPNLPTHLYFLWFKMLKVYKNTINNQNGSQAGAYQDYETCSCFVRCVPLPTGNIIIELRFNFLFSFVLGYFLLVVVHLVFFHILQ